MSIDCTAKLVYGWIIDHTMADKFYESFELNWDHDEYEVMCCQTSAYDNKSPMVFGVVVKEADFKNSVETIDLTSEFAIDIVDKIHDCMDFIYLNAWDSELEMFEPQLMLVMETW